MKKKIAYINVVCNGSTGKIVRDLATNSKKSGFESLVCYGRGSGNNKLNCYKIDTKISILFHIILARLGFNGHGSYFSTKKLVKTLKNYNPDIIYLHNIHGYYLNLKVLFNYLKNEYSGRIIWELHDCWAFTGHCSYFTYVNCNKWKKSCSKCPRLNIYPKEYLDTTKREYNFKKKLFSNINNLKIVTPSNWVRDLVKDSFLKQYDIETIYNGIDLSIFKYAIDEKIYNKYNIPKDKKILLGVANVWEERKGLNIFFELSKLIKDDEIIVLVGLNDKQIINLPPKIIGIKRTDNQKELVNIYSIANCFINPSFEETFSLVTVEAMACGLPVVVCGMSAPKELVNEKVGKIVYNYYDAYSYYNAYQKLTSKNVDKKLIMEYAQRFSNKKMIEKNIDIYKE